MRILYYNWAPLSDPLKRGGGVRIYQEGLIDKAIADGHHVTYFSAGVRYNVLRPGVRAVLRRNEERLREFEIVNSPVLSPSHHQFGRQPSPAVESAYADFLLEFISSIGPFDVLHLNNVEGLPVSMFFDRPRLATTRLIVSLHNYHLLCQQVNLWRDEKVACHDYRDGRRCLRCVIPPSRIEVLGACTVHDIISVAVAEGTPGHALAFKVYGRLKRAFRIWLRLRQRFSGPRRRTNRGEGVEQEALWSDADIFRDHRRSGVQLVSQAADTAIAVSDRVAEIYVSHGVPAGKIVTRYIATKFAKQFDRASFKQRTQAFGSMHAPLHLAFLGYARGDKGFFFLLDALAALPKVVQENTRITIAASGATAHRALLEERLVHFKECSIIDGYSHADLPTLLDGVDLGIVPVMWEDCLPQVSYEFVCHGIPIFVSDMGGARELVGPAELIYRAGNRADFVRRLTDVFNHRDVLERFWDNAAIPILSWDTHWSELKSLYEPTASPVEFAGGERQVS